MTARPSSKRSPSRSAPKAAAGALPAAELLLEIGTEELPYQFVAPALQSLAQRAEQLLKEHRLACASVRSFGTPRRLVLVVDSLAARQVSALTEVMGPSKAVAFDAAGQPTKAATGFAGSQGVAVKDLEVRQTAKGEYVFAVKRESGAATPSVLAEILPALITGLSFPKAMRWNDTGMRFARPVRWLLALYGGKVIPIKIGGIVAGDRTWGHRFLGPSGPSARRGLRVADLRAYLKVLGRSGVVPEQDRRRTIILAQLSRLVRSAKGQLHRDEDLLEQAVYTVEAPQALLGSFNPRYLSLPKEILMTAMKEHQGFFSLMGKGGALLPRFISVTNMKLPNMRLIQAGNERVLAARLADAKFFFDEDCKVRLADRVERLKQVIFHQKLGTMHQKTSRVMELASFLAFALAGHEGVASCRRAAQLGKADLLTGIVGEFPTLQGIMGGEYAKRDGESPEVSQAIAEQYLPRAMEGEIPKTLTGQVLSLADRLDTIVAFFHVGLIPSGSEDPYALRRHALAVVRVLVEANLAICLDEALSESRRLIERQGFHAQAVQEKSGARRGASADPLEFIIERLRYYGRTVHGVRDDVLDAILKSTGRASLPLDRLIIRMKQLQAVASRAEFDPLMVGFKRAHRLVEKEQWTEEAISTALFQDASEGQLYNALLEAKAAVPAAIESGDYAKALEALVAMKPAIDAFFVGVMVNADDPALRANRLSLLCSVDRLFMELADFSQIVVQGG
jgi:glycyl-tRNA synthetase beta chain